MNLIKGRLITILILIVAIFALTACSQPASTDQAGSGSGEPTLQSEETPDSITLIGIGDEDVKITVDEIKELTMVNRDVISISSSGEETEHNVSGGLLEELLEKHGISQRELTSIRVTAVDGYSMEIPEEVLKNRDIILAYEMDGKPLYAGSTPIRIIIPEERAMYWVRKVATIEISEPEAAISEQVEKIIIFDKAIENLDKQDYEYYENIDKAIKIEDLFNKFALEGEEQVSIKAADGLQRNERKETFRNAFIKISGKESPMFLSPDLSKGMYIKDILWFSTEKVGFLTVDKALESYEAIKQGEIEGIGLKEVMKDIDLKEGDTYIFTSEDGYSVEISKGDMDKGILYKSDDGSMRVSFEGLPKNTTVKDLLSIEVK